MNLWQFRFLSNQNCKKNISPTWPIEIPENYYIPELVKCCKGSQFVVQYKIRHIFLFSAKGLS